MSIKYSEIIAKITPKLFEPVKKIFNVEYKEIAALKEFIDATIKDFTYPVIVYSLIHDHENRLEPEGNRLIRCKQGITVKQYIYVSYTATKEKTKTDLALLDAVIDYLDEMKIKEN